MLSGKKIYIIAALIGLATTAMQMGYIDAEFYKAILVFLGAGGLATLRAGIAKKK